MSDRRVTARHRRDLSPQEVALIHLAAEGKSDKEIGKALGIAEGSVKGYWTRIRGKMGSGTRTELVLKHFVASEEKAGAVATALHSAKQALVDEQAALAAVILSGENLATVLLNNQGMITGVCNASSKLLGHRVRDMVGRPIDSFLEGGMDGVDQSLAEMKKAEEGGMVRSTREHHRSNGSHFETEHELVALIGPFGQLGGFVRRIRDLTQQHIHEVRIKELELEVALLSDSAK